jgi:nifR3 family TIM-barrel protein
MNFGFWAKLKRPIMALAPMADVTDAAFRRIIAKYGKPDIMWTEFVSADGLCSRGRENLLSDLRYDESERPIVAQIFGSNPDNFKKAAKLLAELGFDGIDINMGCPSRDIEKSGAGAYLIKHPDLAMEIIRATKEGAGQVPVSVKTRIGYKDNEVVSWLTKLVEAEPAAIIIHARTRNEMSKVSARWDVVKQAVDIVHSLRPDAVTRPLIIGNGDIETLSEAKARVAETGCDGVMIGRGIFGNPWLFATGETNENISIEQKLRVMLEHTRLYLDLLGDKKPLEMMKKHYKAYVNGFAGASDLRAELMACNSYGELEAVIDDFLSKLTV